MNTGAEAVETALKICRKWGYEVKGIPENQAQIIVCENNFHGRTTTIISFSNDENARKNFGPLQKALSKLHDDTDALEAALKSNVNIAGFLVEPIQGEAGVYVPTEGYLAALCAAHNVYLLLTKCRQGSHVLEDC
jgi:ornithine--oxo-acid transaminase